MGPSPARRTAFEVLRAVDQRRGEPAPLLHQEPVDELSAADRDLATEIVYGVLRWQARLDFILAHHSRRRLAQVHPAVLLSLRIGLYQMRFLDRIPTRAAVDESVKLCHRYGPKGASGFVNALLRQADRHPDQPALPRAEEDPLGFASITLSHPAWLAERWLHRIGLSELTRRLSLSNTPPSQYLRVDPDADIEALRAELEAENVRCERFPLVPGCLLYRSGPLADSRLYREGRLFVQDAGSQLIAWLVAPAGASSLLDVCAAPGGKATAIAQRAPAGRVFAGDLRLPRLRTMRELAARLGCENISAFAANGTRLPFRTGFSRILLDAPCSGTGTLRRNPDLKWRLEEKDLARHARTQSELLAESSRLLEPGGRLVYATCSTEPEENEDVVARFLESEPGFHRASARSSLPVSAHHLVGPDDFFRTLPERDGTDGYFAAILIRD